MLPLFTLNRSTKNTKDTKKQPHFPSGFVALRALCGSRNPSSRLTPMPKNGSTKNTKDTKK